MPVHHLLLTETTKRWREMQPTDGSPPKCQPEEIAHIRKTKFQLCKILSSFLPPPRKIPMKAPGTLAIQDDLFIQDHHTIVHVKYKKEKCFWIWKWGCSHRWCLNMHKFCCCVNRWKLDGKKFLNFSIHLPDYCRAGEEGVRHLTGRVLVFQSVGWG